ncbi:hypothetical protein SAMN06265365_12259 [Tistlia consotensis]|uniref:Hpr(Ser) kinase/phosphatase n=1 Tax=Tistlia consotensis USBA 355 TaxID=560819 RepID=A0A1Y6CFZ1_9PROT|nr:hypothetical protein [Tistlia consotensis]SMF62966.1 hypothetical protein SAMN05428998_12459 [Tistlia consotensis USBA 355]SNR95344.1 hypothetical protein SAMN06265365_12259 [Tistlia consotensis]
MTATALKLSERYRLSAGGLPPDAGVALSAELPDAVAALISACLPGWSLAAERPAPDAPDLAVSAVPGGFEVRHDLLPGGCFEAGSPLEAANAVAGAATGAWIRAQPGWVQLHAAGVELAGRLTLLLGASGAGKSTLALEFAAAGRRLFGDDRLAVVLPPAGTADRAPEAVALGVGPKLRRPLPAAASAALRRLAEAHTARASETVALVALPAALLARPGERLPVARLVLLERRGGEGGEVPPGLAPAEAPAVLRALLPNALAPCLGPVELLAWAQRLVGLLPCLRLGYREGSEAMALLEDAP